MIQDLCDKKLENQYHDYAPRPWDKVFYFQNDRFSAMRDENDNLFLPKVEDFKDGNLIYLFSIGDDRYFISLDMAAPREYQPESVRAIRNLKYKELAFATATAYHLYQWYRDNRLCGRCGERLIHGNTERVLKCPKCGNSVYPKIAPAVIVAVTDGNRLLLTKYSGRSYKLYALIAGFTEIGETAEETVAREVMEEVGLKVKNIRYFKSQPWGTDLNLLLGYFCDLDGDDNITIDENELSVAEWFEREDIPIDDDGFSLTRAMVAAFKNKTTT